MFPTRLQASWGKELLCISGSIMLSTYLVLNEYMSVSWFFDWKIFFFSRLLSLSKGSYHEPLREQNKESQSPVPKANTLPTQGSMETTVSKLDRTSPSWGGSSLDWGIMEGDETHYQGDINHKWVHPTNPPSIHFGEPAPSDSHPFPHSMNWSFSAQRERCASWVSPLLLWRKRRAD